MHKYEEKTAEYCILDQIHPLELLNDSTRLPEPQKNFINKCNTEIMTI